MKKFLSFAVVVAFFSTAAKAQDTTIIVNDDSKWHRNNLNLRLGPELAFATGDFNKTHQVGVGAAAELDIPIAPRFSLIGYAAFRSYGGDVIPTQTGTKYRRANIIPIRAGINYKLTPNFYVAGQIGESTVKYVESTKTGASTALGIGYFNGFLDIGARWDHEFVYGGLSSFVIQATYVITLGVKR